MQKDKAIGDKAERERGVKICDDFWHQFLGLSLAFVKFKPEADIYDIFNFMREQNGGTSYSESFLDTIDAEVEAEYRKDLKRGRPARY
jgi:hypothetical protein